MRAGGRRKAGGRSAILRVKSAPTEATGKRRVVVVFFLRGEGRRGRPEKEQGWGMGREPHRPPPAATTAAAEEELQCGALCGRRVRLRHRRSPETHPRATTDAVGV